MTVQELLNLFDQSCRRCVLIGDETNGVVAGLDLEGRLFTFLNGDVVSRVNPEAFLNITTAAEYLNPGGDGLWPAPEGSLFGYEYSTPDWRVPPGLSGARFWVAESASGHARIRAEIDLINSRGRGIPTAFGRDISASEDKGVLTVTVKETIEYLGKDELGPEECLLAPWSLCQFDSGPGCCVTFPIANASDVWDLYDPSTDQRTCTDGICCTRTDGQSDRYQIGLAPTVDWLEYVNPQCGLRVRRTAEPLAQGLDYIDITDRPPMDSPDDRGIRFSVYSDPSCFMEIEAAGGAPRIWRPGTSSTVTVHTIYSR
ncbi:MAG: hypothetical protein HN742_38335 [Lentisphaerae bacterium]|nr:hypothetical protein [Lentisphaerota bacterium]MBT4817737.1 hypothetical protein [Lentisphaerota bacterium]MBT5609303.1 hypothetical protein [Lentisphaerota bacterium]MBT7059403.1 hypothetical protein [Lentisphaerota bacterium]MBT7847787.1 hypothetical protein [Lentisphaerota bacterium]